MQIKAKKFINTTLCLLVCLQMVSCKVVTNKGIDKKLKDFVEVLEDNNKSSSNDYKIAQARRLKKKADKIEKLINRAPKLTAWETIKSHNDKNRRAKTQNAYNKRKSKIRTWMNDVKNLTTDIHTITYDMGKNSYAMTDDGRLENTAVQMAENEIITLYSLVYLRNLSEGYITRSLGYMNKLSSKKMDKFSKNDEEFKLEVLQQYMAYMGMIKILDSDAQKTLKKLKRMRDRNILPSEYNENIAKLLGSEKKKNSKKLNAFKEFKEETLTEEQMKELNEAMAAFETSFNKKSLLFDPANPDHPLIHLFVVASNLSWGLINTMVGGAFVATAAILAPVSRVVNTLINTLFPRFMFRMYEFDFPEIRIAQSRIQLYADVCGLGIVSGKMSAGLFELDFCSGYSFASGHEGGHAKQSAILGPLYFPAAILSYVLVGGHGGFIEAWADIWAVDQTW